MNKKKISVIGEVNVDKISYVSHYPQRGSKIDVKETIYDIGGTSAAIAAFLGEFKMPVRLISSWGNDVYGEMTSLFFRAKNIVTSIDHVEKTLVNSVYIDNQFNSRTIYRDTRESNSLSKKHLIELLESTIVLFDRQENGLFDEFIKRKDRTTKIIIDTSIYFTEHTLKLFKMADHSIVPEEFVYNMDLSKSFGKNLEMLKKIKKGCAFWVTLGERGCIQVNEKTLRYFPAPKVKCVDNLGAGDVFRGAFAYGLYKGWDTDKVVIFSNVAAALQCTKRGNCSAVPTVEKTFTLMDSFAVTPKDITIREIETQIKGEVL